jgi:WD40 repeat protein
LEPDTKKVIDIGTGWAENVSWSPDGSLIATSLSKTVYVYSASGEEVWRTSDHQSTVSTIAWTNKGELATACYGQVQFLDGVSGNLIQKLEWKGSLVSIALSSDSDVVACGSQDNSVHFWRRSSGNDSKMSGYPFKPSALSFNNKGTLLATGGSEAATVWNFEGDGPEGTSPLELDYHSDAITSLLFSNHSNRLLSGCRNGTVVLWEISPDNTPTKLGVGQVADTVAELYWRPDDRAVAALDRQGGVTVWRI